MANKNKPEKKKKKLSLAAKIGLPALVGGIVVGSFFINWNHLGRSPVGYYGIGAVPMLGMCPAKTQDEDNGIKKAEPPAKESSSKQAKPVKKKEFRYNKGNKPLNY